MEPQPSRRSGRPCLSDMEPVPPAWSIRRASGGGDAPEWYRELAPEARAERRALLRPAPRPRRARPEPAAGCGAGEGVEGYIRQAAAQRGIDPDVAVRVAQSEGGATEPARRGTFATGSSWWPFQLHYGGAGTPYEKYGTVAGWATPSPRRPAGSRATPRPGRPPPTTRWTRRSSRAGGPGTAPASRASPASRGSPGAASAAAQPGAARAGGA